MRWRSLFCAAFVALATAGCQTRDAQPCPEFDEAERLFERLTSVHLDTTFGHPSFAEAVRLYEAVPSRCPRKERAKLMVAAIRQDMEARKRDEARTERAWDRLDSLDGQVVVYTTSWCGYCKKTKAALSRWGVRYIEKDVEASPDAQRELDTKAARLGIKANSVPFIDVDGVLLQGYDERELRKTLKQSGIL